PTLTPASPVSISWDNGAGLIFHRTYTIDDHYLFTVAQSVENKTAATVQLFAYARAVREGTPKVQNFFVQHEGPAGVLGSNNQGSKKYTDVRSDKLEHWDNTTGWLGFTDKYWATMIIATPGEQVNARFLYGKPSGFDEYQSDYVTAAPLTVAAGQTATDRSY